MTINNPLSGSGAAALHEHTITASKAASAAVQVAAACLPTSTHEVPGEAAPFWQAGGAARQELLTHSLLPASVESRKGTEPFIKSDSAKLLAHALGDSFIQETDLEGFNQSFTAMALLGELAGLEGEQRTLVEPAILQLQQLTREAPPGLLHPPAMANKAQLAQLLDEAAKEVLNKLSSLPRGQSLFLPGGYTGQSSGHAMLYEFIRQEDDTFTLKVYNTGGGTEFHPHTERLKRLISPLIHYQNIPFEKLLVGEDHAAFLRALLEPVLHKPTNWEWSGDFIYHNILSHLQEFRVVAEQELQGFMSAQRSATCTWRVLKALVRQSLPRDIYKEVFLKVNLSILVKAYKEFAPELQTDSVEAEQGRELLRNCAKTLLSALSKWSLKGGNPLFQETATAAAATALSLLERLDAAENQIKAARQKEIEQLQIDTNFTPASHEFVEWQNSLPPPPTVTIQAPREGVAVLSSAPPADPAELTAWLKSVRATGDELKTRDSAAAAQFYRSALLALPVPQRGGDTYYTASSLPPLEVLQIITEISNELATLLIPRIRGSDDRIALVSAWVIEHALALECERRLGSSRSYLSYPIWNPIPSYLRAPLIATVTDRHLEERLSLLQTYCERHNGSFRDHAGLLFDYHNLTLGEEDFKKLEHSSWAQFWHAILLDHPRLQSRHGDYKASNESYSRHVGPFTAAASSLLVDPSPLETEGLGHIACLLQGALSVQAVLSNSRLSGGPGKTWSLNSQISGGERALGSQPPPVKFVPSFGFTKLETGAPPRSYICDALAREINKGGGHSRENAALKRSTNSERSFPSEWNPSFCRDLDRLFAAPSLSPSNFLFIATNHIEVFSEPSAREAFFEILYQAGKSSSQHSLLAEATESTSFQQLMQDFVTAGLNHYYYNQPTQKVVVEEALFFLQNIVYMRRFQSEEDSPFMPQAEELITEWLSDKRLTDVERCKLHLQRIFLLSLLPKERLTQEQIRDIYESYAYFQQYAGAYTDHVPAVEKEVADYMRTLAAFLSGNPPTEELCHKIVKAVAGEQTATLQSREFPRLTFTKGEGGRLWTLHLVTGQISHDEGVLGFAEKPHGIDNNALYQRLFQGRSHSFRKNAAIYYFTDPLFGEMRYIPPSTFQWDPAERGEWLQLIENEKRDKLESYLPDTLLKDKLIWCSQSVPHSVTICRPEDNKPLARLQQEGETVAVTCLEEPFVGYQVSRIKSTALAPFEQESLLEGLGHEGHLEVIRCPRYRYLGSLLSFEKRGEELIWSGDPRFKVAKEQPKGLLPAIHNYLMVENAQGQKKLLVPARSIEPISPFAKQAEVDPALAQGAPGSFALLVFDLQADGSLRPTSVEATLYEALLALQNKDYHKAYESLNTIPLLENLSPDAEQILEQIIALKATQGANSAAIKVRAASLLFAKIAHDKRPISTKRALVLQEAMKAYDSYATLFSKVRKELELDVVSEQACVQALLDAKAKIDPSNPVKWSPARVIVARDERKNFLATGKYRPQDIIVPSGSGSSLNKDILGNLKVRLGVACEINSDAFRENPYRRQAHGPLLPSMIIEDAALNDFFFSYYNRIYRGSREERRALALQLSYLMPPPELVFTKDKREELAVLVPVLIAAAKSAESLPLIPSWAGSSYDRYSQEYQRQFADFKTQMVRFEDDLIAKLSQEISPQARQAELSVPPAYLGESGKEAVAKRSVRVAGSSLTCHLPEAKRVMEKRKALGVECLVARPTSSSPAPGIVSGISSDEKYQAAVEHEWNAFAKDLEAGKRAMEEGPSYILQEGVTLNDIKTRVKAARDGATRELDRLQQELLQTANATSAEAFLQETVLEASEKKEALTLPALVGLFLRRDREAYEKANPYLKELINRARGSVTPEFISAAEHLYELTGRYLFLMTEKEALARAEKLTDELLVSGDEDRQVKMTELGGLLSHDHNYYNVNEQPECLVFEYYSGMLIRQNQVDTLKILLQQPNNVTQMIMGGGKSTLLAPLISFIAAKPGRLSLYVTAAPLFQTTASNLQSTQKRYFDQTVIPLEVSREDLTNQQLENIVQLLERAMGEGSVVVMKAETLQAFELEYISALKASHGRAQLLEKILTIFRGQADALIDEVDLVLDAFSEVNFPQGHKTAILPSRAHLMKHLYTLLVSPTLQVEGVSLRDYIGLAEDHQMRISAEDFKNKVVPLIVQALSAKESPLSPLLHDPQKAQAFLRYCRGEVPAAVIKALQERSDEGLSEQDKQMAGFLRHLEELHRGGNATEKELVELAALCKHALTTLLPATFSKSGGRQYGRSRSGPPGQVVPYLGVGTPATTEFGYHYETLCYHFQTALQFGVTKEEVAHLGKVYLQRAMESMQRDKIPLEHTEAYERFRAITGSDLLHIEEEQTLQEAFENVTHSFANKEFDKILAVELEAAQSTVSYYSEYVASDAHALVHQLATRKCFSGTPWNAEGYDPSLADHLFLDRGTEGKFASTALKRNSPVHVATSEDPRAILSEIIDHHPHKNRMRGLMDPGGFFKRYDNREVAQLLLDKMSSLSLNPPIKGVLFFYRAPGMQTPDALALLKPGMKEPLIIQGTSKEAIEKAGISPKEYFVYYDERHTTGVDIEQMPDAINLMTVDENILQRTLFQSMARLRRYLTSQEVEYVVTAGGVPHLVGGEATVDAIIQTAVKNQAEHKADYLYRCFRQMIDNAFRQEALKLVKTSEDKRRLFRVAMQGLSFSALSPFLTRLNQDNPYAQCGRPDSTVPVEESLSAYALEKQQAFTAALASLIKEQVLTSEQAENIAGSLKENTEHILARAAASPSLVKEVQEPLAAALGSEVTIEMAVQTERETSLKAEVEVNVALQQNNTIFDGHSFLYENGESEWDEKRALEFIDALKRGGAREELTSMGESQAELTKNHPAYRFPEIYQELLPTTNYASPFDRTISFFHNSYRPADHILLVRQGDSFKPVLLSMQEAEFFAHFLEQQYGAGLQDVWLIKPDGHLLVDSPAPLPGDLKSEAQLAHLYVVLNAFNGNISYLLEHPEETAAWLHEPESLAELKKDYLGLKSYNDPHAYEQWRQSRLLQLQPLHKSESGGEEPPLLTEENVKTFTARQVKAYVKEEHVSFLLPYQVAWLDRQETVRALSRNQLAHISPHQVPLLQDEQIQNLPAASRLVAVVPAAKLPLLREALLPLLSSSQISLLTSPEQINKLQEKQLNHLSVKQLPWLTKERLQGVTKPALLQALPLERLPELTDRQKGRLSGKQVEEGIKAGYLLPGWQERSPAELQKELSCFTTEAQIKALPEELLKYISPRLVPLLGLSFVNDKLKEGLITGEQIAALSDPFLIKNLDSRFWQYLREEQQLLALGDDALIRGLRANLIPQRLIASLTTERVIQQLPASLLSHINLEKQISYLTPQQITEGFQLGTLPDEGVGLLQTQEQLRALPRAKRALIKEHKQLATLYLAPPFGGQSYTNEFRKDLEEGILSPELLRAVTEGELIVAVPASLLSHLPQQAWRFLSHTQVGEAFTKPPYSLSLEAIKELSNKWSISAVPPALRGYLLPVQLAELPPKALQEGLNLGHIKPESLKDIPIEPHSQAHPLSGLPEKYWKYISYQQFSKVQPETQSYYDSTHTKLFNALKKHCQTPLFSQEFIHAIPREVVQHYSFPKALIPFLSTEQHFWLTLEVLETAKDEHLMNDEMMEKLVALVRERAGEEQPFNALPIEDIHRYFSQEEWPRFPSACLVQSLFFDGFTEEEKQRLCAYIKSSDIKDVPAEYVPYLPLEEVEVSVLSREQIEGALKHRPSLEWAHKFLSKIERSFKSNPALISAVPAELIEQLPNQFFCHLSEEQLKAYFALEEAPKAREVCWALQDKKQLSLVPTKYLGYLSQDQRNYLTTEQLLAGLEKGTLKAEDAVYALKDTTNLPVKYFPLLDAYQLYSVEGERLLQALHENVLEGKEKTAVPVLPSRVINKLEPRYWRYLSAHQIENGLTPEVFIKGLTEGLISPEIIAELSKREFIQALPISSLSSLPKDKISDVSEEQAVQGIASGMLSLAQLSADRIATLPVALLSQLPPESLNQLSDERVGVLPLSLLPRLSLKKLQEVPGEKIKAAIEAGHFDHDLGQLGPLARYASPAKFWQLAGETVAFENLSDEQLLYGLEQKKISVAVLGDYNYGWSASMAEVIPRLTPEQVADLPPQPLCLEWLSGSQVPALNSAALQKLKKELLAYVTPSQVPFLTDEQIPHLPAPAQIRAVPAEKLPLLTQTQADFIAPEQFHKLNENPLLLRRLPNHIIAYTPPDLVMQLSDSQLYHLRTAEQVKALPVEKWHFLSNYALGRLTPVEFWAASPPLTAALFAKMSPEQFTEGMKEGGPIGQAHISMLTTEHARLIKHVRADLLPYVNETLWPFIDDFMAQYECRDENFTKRYREWKRRGY